MGEGNDPLDFLVLDGTYCGICYGQGRLPSEAPASVLAEAGRKSMRGAQHSRYRRLARARVLKHMTSAHRKTAERLWPNWVQAHSDQAAPSPAA